MKIRTTTENIVTEPNLHDGFADGLSVDRSIKSAQLDCTSLDGQKFKISFLGVRALCANEFRQGNIIDTIWVYKGKTIPTQEISSLLFGESLKSEVLEGRVEKIRQANEYFVSLWSSYGLGLKVICKEIECQAV